MKRIWIAVILVIVLHFLVYAPKDSPTVNPTTEFEKPSAGMVERVRVTRIIDGDTFDIEDGRRVRLIGIDTPERDELYFEEAKEKLGELILGEDIEMMKDVSDTDKYERLLRYVFIEDTFINAEMISSGYAVTMSIAPDTAYYALFRDLLRQARESGQGMWENN